MSHFPQIIGVLNITPDSFSDGGDFFAPEKALKRAEKMLEEGADIIDIGAESTAPHNTSISGEEEWARLTNILPILLEKKIPISLDSQKSEIWEKFLELSQKYEVKNVMINDVSGLGKNKNKEKEEQKKIELLQKFPDTKIVIMFSRDISESDSEDLSETILSEISEFFSQKIQILEHAGIQKSRIILDTGMGGFLSKNPEISFLVIRNFQKFLELGCKLYLGTSRKSFLSEVSGNISPEKRVISSVVSSLVGIQNGANYVRVHDVQEMREGLETLKKCS